MPHTLEGTKLGEKDQAPKELFSKTASMSDTYGFSIKLSEDDLYEDRASRIPKGLVVTYSIYGDAPKLTVHREGEKDLIETGVKTNIGPGNEGVNWGNMVSISLKEENLVFTGKFKDETNKSNTSLLHDTRYTRTGLGRITVSELEKVDSISPLLE